MPAAPARIRLDVWSDYVCPFCYLELPVLDALREEMGEQLVVEWRAYELRPEPAPTLDPAGDYLRETWARAVYPMAEERGMTLRLPPVQPRSRRALEVAEHARTLGPPAFARVHRALFVAFFEDGRDLGDRAVLVEVGAGAGLDAAALGAALDAGTHTARVLEDERLAGQLGLEGVPAMVLRRDGEPYGAGRLVSGAHPLERLRLAVQSVRDGDASVPGHVLRRRLPLGDS